MIECLISKIEYDKKLCIRSFGIDFKHIQLIVAEINGYLSTMKAKQGRHCKLNPLLSTLLYLYFLKNYVSLEKLSLLFGVSVSTAWRCIKLMTVLFENLRCLDNISTADSDFLLVDGTETEVERPISSGFLVSFYGRKKKFSVKTQVIVDRFSLKVCSVECREGSMHDFELFKWAYDNLSIRRKCCLVADAGYTGSKMFILTHSVF